MLFPVNYHKLGPKCAFATRTFVRKSHFCMQAQPFHSINISFSEFQSISKDAMLSKTLRPYDLSSSLTHGTEPV